MIHHHTTRGVAPVRTSRSIRAFIVTAAVLAGTAGPALADPGQPGTTFPEQPGTALQGGCDAILTNPNNAFENRADPASSIVTGLTIDACVPGS